MEEGSSIAETGRTRGQDVGFILHVNYKWIALSFTLITTGIPYSVFSNLLRSVDPASLGQLPEREFINGFKVASFVFAVINTCAIVPSFLRGTGGFP